MTHTQPVPTTRRMALGKLLAVGGAVFIPAWNETVEAADTITCVPTTPTVTEGPYWVDEKLFRSDIRTDPSNGSVRQGVLLKVVIQVQNLASSGCTPLAGAYVDIWHCDAKGIYSDEPTYNPGGGTGSVNTVGQKFLRGYQITDENGRVEFTTVWPGWYTGRTIHIHLRVRTYNGSTVLSNFVSQIFFNEEINNLVLAQSAYARSTGRDTTNASDNIYRVANQDRMMSTTTGSLSEGYTSTITIGAAFQTATASAPAISNGGVVNAVSGAAAIAPGSWVSIYGSNLAPAARALQASDLSGTALPTALGGSSVQINGKAAYVQYVSPTQINVLAPDDASAGSVNVTVTNANGTSNTAAAGMQTFSPALSVLSGYVRALRAADSALVNGTGTAETGYKVTAAVGPGEVISLFGTGFGPAASAPAAGQNFSGAYPTNNAVTVAIGGQPATVLWAGLIGPGLYQINVTVPASLSDGDHSVIATVGSVSSSSSAVLKVLASARLAYFFRRDRHVLAAARRGPAPLPATDFAWLQRVLHATQTGAYEVPTGCLVQLA